MSNQRKRNFQIEAFKHRVIMDPRYAEHTWKILEHAIHEIYNKNASSLSFEELYSDVSNQRKRNFQIEAFKLRVIMDPRYAEHTWKILEHAIHEIYNKTASSLSFEEFY
ncbi:Cullin-3B, partial [Lathyrus oleraceus]